MIDLQPALPGFETHRKPPAVTVASIQREAADFFGIGLRDLLSDRRAPNVAGPRQVAMWLAKTHTSHSLPAIGRLFRRDHTTVQHAVRQVEKRAATDPQLAAQIQALEARL